MLARGRTASQLGSSSCSTMQVWGGLGGVPLHRVQPQTKDPLPRGAALTPCLVCILNLYFSRTCYAYISLK